VTLVAVINKRHSEENMMINVQDVRSEPFCVYGHFEGDTCFYIGMGQLRRAFEFTTDRSAPHRDRMSNCEFSVTIFSRFACRKKALDHEREMIRLFTPIYNKHLSLVRIRQNEHQQAATERKRIKAEKARTKRAAQYENIKPIKCVETGRYFYGNSHAGREMNLCRARISANVLGKCRSVDQYHFIRATWEESGLEKRSARWVVNANQ
jgi:hypothetical protein